MKKLKEVLLKFPLSENFPKQGKLEGAFEIDGITCLKFSWLERKICDGYDYGTEEEKGIYSIAGEYLGRFDEVSKFGLE